MPTEGTPPLTKDELSNFTGSTEFYQHQFNRAVILTEGVRFLAERGQAFWLIDAIASHIGSAAFNAAAAKDDRIALLHFWNLAVRDDGSAELTARADSGEPNFVSQTIPCTDFPLKSVDVWAGANELDGWTLMLPSEY